MSGTSSNLTFENCGTHPPVINILWHQYRRIREYLIQWEYKYTNALRCAHHHIIQITKYISHIYRHGIISHISKHGERLIMDAENCYTMHLYNYRVCLWLLQCMTSNMTNIYHANSVIFIVFVWSFLTTEIRLAAIGLSFASPPVSGIYRIMMMWLLQFSCDLWHMVST